MASMVEINRLVDFYTNFKDENNHLIKNKIKYYEEFFKYKKKIESEIQHLCNLIVDFKKDTIFFKIEISDLKIIIDFKPQKTSIINIEKNFAIKIMTLNRYYNNKSSLNNFYEYIFYNDKEYILLEIYIDIKNEKLNELNVKKGLIIDKEIKKENLINTENCDEEYANTSLEIINNISINKNNLKIENLELLNLCLDINEDLLKNFDNIYLYT